MFSTAVPCLNSAEVLKGTTDTNSGEAPWRNPGKIGAVENDATGAWPQYSANDVEQGCLSGTIGADDTANLARRHGETDIVDRFETSETLGNVFDREQWGHDNHLLRRL